MRRVFAPLRLQADPLHQALVLGLQFHQRLGLRQRRHDRARPASAERFQLIKPQFELGSTHFTQR